MIYSTDDLIEMLNDLKLRIETGDSLQGSLAYTCMEDHLAPGEWEVTGCYRFGNSDGQGGMGLLPHSRPGQQEGETRSGNDQVAEAVMSLFKHLIRLDHEVQIGGGAYVVPFYRALADWARANGIDLSRGSPIHVVDFAGPTKPSSGFTFDTGIVHEQDYLQHFVRIFENGSEAAYCSDLTAHGARDLAIMWLQKRNSEEANAVIAQLPE